MPPSPAGTGQRAALPAIDRKRLGVEELGIEVAIDRMRQIIGIGDHSVADAEGPLGRFDQPVDVIETLTLRDAQALEQRENDQ